MTSISPVSYTPPTPPRVSQTPKAKEVEVDFDGSAGTAMAASGVMQRELDEKGTSNTTVNMINDMSSQVVQSRMAAQTMQTYAASASGDTEADDGSSDNDGSVSLNTTAIRIPNNELPEIESPPVATPYGASISDRMASAYNAAGSPPPAVRRVEAYA